MIGRRITRRAAFVHCGLLLSGAACSRTRDPRTLRVAYAPITFAKLYEAIAEAFMATHPNLRVELLPATSSAGTSSRDFTLALVDDEPDVSHVGLNHVRLYAQRNLALPLDRFIESEKTALTTHPTIGKIGGETRALPFAVSVPVNYFNTELVRRAGHDPAAIVTATWPQLVAIARDISTLGHPVSGMFFDPESGQALTWQMLVLGYGGRMMSADERTIAFGGEAGRRSAALLAEIGRAGQLDMSRENARMAFAAGLLGAYTNTSSNMDRFSAGNMGFDVTVAPLPIEPGTGRLPAAGNAVVITTRKRERHDAAWQYVRFAAGPIGQALMAKLSGYLTFNRAALADPTLLGSYLQANPQYAALYATIDILDEWYSFPGPRREQIAKGITDKMRTLLIRRAEPDTALVAMVRDAQRLVDWG